MATKVVSSAIIVAPPENLWGPIQAIRQEHDKAYERWMPHINLIYPFYHKSQFASALPKLEEALKEVKPFTVTLGSFDYFQHGAASTTLFLHPTVQPSNALLDLQAAIERVFPDCNEQSTKSEEGFHAHLTVGQFKGKTAAQNMQSDLARTWKPITWRVEHIQLISRTPAGPFRVIHTVSLGSPSVDSSQPKPLPGQRKRPHGESLARAPPEARRQDTKPGPDEQARSYRRDPWASSFAPRGRPDRRPFGGRGQPISPAPVPVQAPVVAITKQTSKPKLKKKKAPKQKRTTAEHNPFGSLSDGGTVCGFNNDHRRTKRDPLTCSFATVHNGYKYRKYTAAVKVVKPVELLQHYSKKHIKAMRAMMAELARLEEEERSLEKGKERIDTKEIQEQNSDQPSKTEDGNNDEDMQEIIKDLVLDLTSLNAGKAVKLEPEFEAPAPDFFIAPEYLPSNAGHAANPVFFDEDDLDEPDDSASLVKKKNTQVFWDESCVSTVADEEASFGPDRPDPFFKIEGKPGGQRKTKKIKPIKGEMDEDQRELLELERLLEDGFITQEKYDERTQQIKENIRLRKTLASKRKAELKRQALAEQKFWEERERKLMAERAEQERQLDEETKRQLSQSVLRDFLDGRISAKEVAQKVKSGIVTVDQLLSLWKTELRPLQLTDYYPLATYQPGPSKHSKIMADVMYLLRMSNPSLQCSNTLEPAALPQTAEVLHTVEKIAAQNPGLVRKFAHVIRTEREMRTEWQRDVQERLLAL